MAEVIAKRSKPFSDGEFVKKCFHRVADVLCPEKKEQFKQISLSRQTIARRIEELGNSIVSDNRILFSCLSRDARRGILSLHFLFCDLDAITSYPWSSPRSCKLDLMIKHDFWFYLDLDLLHLF